jgi:hypothetical protein
MSTHPGSPHARRGAGPAALVALLLAAAACSDRAAAGADGTAGGPARSPAPTFFVADQLTSGRAAARAVVDAGTVWLLDAHGDFVFDADPARNWTAQTGLAVTWSQVPGAVRYHVMGRGTAAPPLEWKELLVLPAPDPRLEPAVVARGVNPWSAGFGTAQNPWSFGNGVELAVTAEDASGAILGREVSESLVTADAFPGMLAQVEVDSAGLPTPYDASAERGVGFEKVLRLGFSEPMRTTQPPELVPQSANLSVRAVLAAGWGSTPAAPSSPPPAAAAHAFLRLSLRVKGACTELLVARAAGDALLPVRDTFLFAAGSAFRLLFLDGASGAWLGEATGIGALDPALPALALSTPLAAGLPAGSLVCALSGQEAALAGLVGELAGGIAVTDASPVAVGEQVAVHDPSSAGARHDLRTVTGIDTVEGHLLLDTPLGAGHGPGSIVVPLPGLGGEVALRPSATLALQRDVAGAPGAELVVSSAAGLMVGDTLLVDADGDLRTTPDQAQATVTAIRLLPGGAQAVVADLPPGLILLHGRARVVGLGDAFRVTGIRDSSAAAPTPLDPHRDQFTADGLLY